MGVKRKGSKRFKKWKSYRSGKHGIVSTTKYIKNTIPYEFKIKGGGKLHVNERNKKDAVKSAKHWERWLKRTGRGNDKVDFSKGISKWNEKTMSFKKLKR